MPPNPSVTAFFTNHSDGLVEVPPLPNTAETPAPPANWPGGPPAAMVQEWNTLDSLTVSKQKREIPSKDRCFYLIMSEREVNSSMAIGNGFGVEEAAILEGETKVVKNQQTMFIVKCVGRLEFVKPKFEELEDYVEAGPTTA